MDMTNQQYDKFVSSRAKPSPLWKDCAWAFFVGGAICAGGQGLLALYQSWGADKEDFPDLSGLPAHRLGGV